MADSTPDVEHECAVFWDERGHRNRIHFSELASDARYAEVKLLELWDESEQVRVNARPSSKGLRHFYSKVTGDRLFDRGENNPAHDERVASLFESLDGLDDGWRISYQARAADPLQSVFGPMPSYSWGFEITRIVSPVASVRHDIYGDSGIRMSVRRPAIAIEVVHSHYPTEATFQALIDRSRDAPLIVFFDFTKVPRNRILVVDKAGQTLTYRSYTFRIFEGAVWLGAQRREDIDSAAKLCVAASEKYKDWK